MIEVQSRVVSIKKIIKIPFHLLFFWESISSRICDPIQSSVREVSCLCVLAGTHQTDHLNGNDLIDDRIPLASLKESSAFRKKKKKSRRRRRSRGEAINQSGVSDYSYVNHARRRSTFIHAFFRSVRRDDPQKALWAVADNAGDWSRWHVYSRLRDAQLGDWF